SCHLCSLPSFPTRRSSDLVAPARFGVFSTVTFAFTASLSPTLRRNCSRHRVKNLEKTKLKKVILTLFTCSVRILAGHCGTTRVRSEEHTSELQSPDHLVCR